MISIRQTVTELERLDQLRRHVLECYVASIQNSAHYAIELEEGLTAAYRKHLTALAEEVATGEAATIGESRATMRGLLREYRDQASAYLNGLREKLARSAEALADIMDTMSQSDGDQQQGLRASLGKLREVAAWPEALPVRGALLEATNRLESQVEEIRRQNQIIIGQFQVEIRMLHQRIDSLEAAAAADSMTKLLTRAETEKRIRSGSSDWRVLILVRTSGLREAEDQYGGETAAELAGAFGKRLRAGLPPDAVIGRWAHEEFIVKVDAPETDAANAARWISDNLSGAYACLNGGKAVRPRLLVAALALTRDSDEPPARLLWRLSDFFKK